MAGRLLRQYRPMAMRDKVNIIRLAYGESGTELLMRKN
jgi:hypothetical protein